MPKAGVVPPRVTAAAEAPKKKAPPVAAEGESILWMRKDDPLKGRYTEAPVAGIDVDDVWAAVHVYEPDGTVKSGWEVLHKPSGCTASMGVFRQLMQAKKLIELYNRLRVLGDIAGMTGGGDSYVQCVCKATCKAAKCGEWSEAERVVQAAVASWASSQLGG